MKLSAAQLSVLGEAAESERLGHRAYVPPRRCTRTARILAFRGLVRWTTRWGWRAIAITDAGRDELGLPKPGAPGKLRLIQGGRK